MALTQHMRTIAHSLVLVLLSSGLAVAEARVIDGDTLELGGTIYRLNGIDAPEHGQTCGNWNCGSAATDALVDLTKGRTVTCDAVTEDAYGRVIATCFADGTDIGGSLVDKGMAWAFLRYSDVYAPNEASARASSIGVWTGRYPTPWEFRENRWSAAAANAPRGCPIKGNISQNGRIYHTPWSPWYSRTKISAARGERWFCTEAEAIASGWRAPYWD